MARLARGFTPKINKLASVTYHELIDFMRMPSVARPGFIDNVQRSAFWLGEICVNGELPILAVSVPRNERINSQSTQSSWFFGIIENSILRKAEAEQSIAEICLNAAEYKAPNPDVALVTVARFLHPSMEIVEQPLEESTAFS